MGRLQQVIDARYNNALAIAAIEGAIILTLGGLTLDGGVALRKAACVLIAYLAIPAVVVTIRPTNPSLGDLFAIKHGYFIIVVTVLFAGAVYPPLFEWLNLLPGH